MEKEIVSFDLFKLHLPAEDKSSYQWVCACGKGLDDELKKLLEECKCNKYEISKNISKKFRLSNSTVQKMLYNRAYIPLLVIREIVKEWAKRLSKSKQDYMTKLIEIQEHIERMKVSSAKKYIKLKNNLTQELAKICGANAADGSLNLYVNFSSRSLEELISLKTQIQKIFNQKTSKIVHKKNSTLYTFGVTIKSDSRELLKKLNLKNIILSTTYQIELLDEDYFAVNEFRKWLKECFNIYPKIKPYHNGWEIQFCSKIIGRLLNLTFDFPLGKKSSIVDEPQIIKKAPLTYRKAFAQGVMTFDGTVELRGSIRLDVRSEKLRNSIKKILELDGLKVKNYDYKDGYSFHTPINLNKLVAKRWLTYFIKGSEKWHKLNDVVHGFQGHTNSIEEFEDIIRTVYRRQGKSKVELFDIFNSARNLNEFTRLQIECQKNISKSQTLGYLRILMRMNILKRKSNSYVFNNDMKYWRVPSRPESKIIGLELPK